MLIKLIEKNQNLRFKMVLLYQSFSILMLLRLVEESFFSVIEHCIEDTTIRFTNHFRTL
jgi:hypothetical protein